MVSSPQKHVPFEKLRLEEVFPRRDPKSRQVGSPYRKVGYSEEYQAHLEDGLLLDLDIEVPSNLLEESQHYQTKTDNHRSVAEEIIELNDLVDSQIHEIKVKDVTFEEVDESGHVDNKLPMRIDEVAEKEEDDKEEFQSLSDFQSKSPQPDPANDWKEVPLTKTNLNLKRYANIIDDIEIDHLGYESRKSNQFVSPNVWTLPKVSEEIKKACYEHISVKENLDVASSHKSYSNLFPEDVLAARVSKIGVKFQDFQPGTGVNQLAEPLSFKEISK